MSSRGRSARRLRVASTAPRSAGRDQGAGVLTGEARRTRAPWNPNEPERGDVRTELPFRLHSRTNPSARRYPRDLSVWRHSPNDPRGARPNEPSAAASKTNPSDDEVPDEPERLANPNEPGRPKVQTNLSRVQTERTRAVRTSNGAGVSAEVIDLRKPLDVDTSPRRCGAAIAQVVAHEAGSPAASLLWPIGADRRWRLDCCAAT